MTRPLKFTVLIVVDSGRFNRVDSGGATPAVRGDRTSDGELDSTRLPGHPWTNTVTVRWKRSFIMVPSSCPPPVRPWPFREYNL
eukprot:92-Hanusia_phi.AAC.1